MRGLEASQVLAIRALYSIMSKIKLAVEQRQQSSRSRKIMKLRKQRD